MDRFIVPQQALSFQAIIYLKSNMDRFIGEKIEAAEQERKDLKSNMDRFIGLFIRHTSGGNSLFKIQYG